MYYMLPAKKNLSTEVGLRNPFSLEIKKGIEEQMDSGVNDLKSLQITSADDDEELLEEIEVEGGEDDDDDEEEEGVTLGFVEKPKNPCFPSKAGGVPAWLDPVDSPREKARTCGFCGEALQFLLQVYAPISEKESTFHRTLFLFTCPSMSCVLRDQHEQWKRDENPRSSVKVFHCQLPRSNHFYSSEPPRHDGTDKPLNSGAVLCSRCGTWKGDKICSSCKRARYCSEKHQGMHWRSGHKNDCCQIISSSEASASTPGNSRGKLSAISKAACSTLWPEYVIVIEDKLAFDTEMSEENSCATALVSKHDKIDETFQLLSDEFEADDNKKVGHLLKSKLLKPLSKC